MDYTKNELFQNHEQRSRDTLSNSGCMETAFVDLLLKEGKVSIQRSMTIEAECREAKAQASKLAKENERLRAVWVLLKAIVSIASNPQEGSQ